MQRNAGFRTAVTVFLLACALPPLAAGSTRNPTRLVFERASLGRLGLASRLPLEPALRPDTYVEVYKNGVKVCETEVAIDTFEPVWQKPCDLRAAQNSKVRVEVKSFAPEGDRLLGSWVGTLDDLGKARGSLAFGSVRSFLFSIE
ncbi:MAG TPA: hypothetical protein VN851_01680 [Thermoanaerobaculia bacterium]|nr:hypothetical protein [Thermoanaerobaculia bacterium]